jgi:hypothetical protein
MTGGQVDYKEYNSVRYENSVDNFCAFDLSPMAIQFVDDISGPFIYTFNSHPDNQPY